MTFGPCRSNPRLGTAVVPVAPLVALWVAASPAAAQNLCEIYSVRSGDTLSEIANTAGVSGGYQMVFNANRDLLSNPNRIEIGQRLKIPCADGSLPGTVITTAAPAAEPAPAPEATVAAEPEPAPEPAPAATDTAAAPAAEPAALPPIRFLTGGAYAPFTDPDLPQQGMFTELVMTALNANETAPESSVTFVDDWGEHLSVLLPSGAFDMGFPWYRPNCEQFEYLGEDSQNRCTNYNMSEPFYEAVVGYYTLDGSSYASVTTPEALMGARLCRPAGWFTFDLEARQLVEPNVTILVPGTQIECWEALQAGEVDVVTFDALPAEEDQKTLGITEEITELSDLAELATLHVYTPKTNPNGEKYLALLNAGLAEMRANGKWFEVVSRHLAGQ